MFSEDLTIFFDNAGLASAHSVNGTAGILCIVGERQQMRSDLDGKWITAFKLTLKKTDITTPKQWDKVTLNSISYNVESVDDDGSVLTILLSDDKRAGQKVSSTGYGR